MDEDRAGYLDIEQMVKRELRDAERVYVNGILPTPSRYNI